MTTVKDLLAMPIGTKTGGGFPLTIRTVKKKWEVNGTWYQRALLVDETDEILATVKIRANRPLTRGSVIKIIVAIMKDTMMSKKGEDYSVPLLFVDQFDIPTMTADEAFGPNESQYYNCEPPWIVRGKIETWIVSAYVQAGHSEKEMETFAKSPELDRTVKHLMRR
ncbi:hypothetical protein LCGC14_1970430 [marine sediment metagenome]|uniref:Uncharacterized protein n=1 Tax=marine sediment metagenome TaxID=412755 RepID=A0A0F9HQA0_9ZZZZ